MNDYQELLDLINKYQIITIYRHQRPDGDAVGSQLGLKEFIQDNFKDKQVYALGVDLYDAYPIVDEVSDETIANSLAIVLDTSNRERISDSRYALAKEIVKIDHHPVVDAYGTYNYVNPKAAATAELLVAIFKSPAFAIFKISKRAATYLYSGLLTDTLSFKTSNTTADTLRSASILAESEIDIYDINEHLFNRNLADFNFCNYLRTNLKYEDGLAYALLDNDSLKQFNIDGNKARAYISEINGIEEFKIWVVFTENSEGTFDASVRSKKPYIINTIAQKYNGGGHPNASGIKGLKLETIKDLLDDLKQLI